VPEPLEIIEPVVNYEFISHVRFDRLRHYTESGQVIPVRYQGQTGGYTHQIPERPSPIATGRELWAFAQKAGAADVGG